MARHRESQEGINVADDQEQSGRPQQRTDGSPNPVQADGSLPLGGASGESEKAAVGMFYSFRYRNYRFFWLSNFFFTGAQWVNQVTMGWVVYNMTGSGTILGAISLVRLLPTLLVTPLAGVWADRVNRRVLVASTAFALGVFIAFSPAYGLHTLLVVLCTWLFGLNFVALLAGALVNNPWTIIPILGTTYWTGALLLGRTDMPTFSWHDLTFTGIYQQILPYAVPFALGGLFLSVIGALVSYPAAYLLVLRYRPAPEAPVVQPLPPPDQVG